MAVSEAFNRMDEILLGHTVVNARRGTIPPSTRLHRLPSNYSLSPMTHDTSFDVPIAFFMQSYACALLGSLINRIVSTADIRNYPNAPSQATPESAPV